MLLENRKSGSSHLAMLLSQPAIQQSRVACDTMPVNEKSIAAIKQLLKTNQDKLESAQVPFKNYHRLDWKWSASLIRPVLISNDACSVCLHPDNTGFFETHSIRGERPLRPNAYTYWQVRIASGLVHGTSVMIGVGTQHASLHSLGYMDLIGIDKHSWGLSTKGHVLHDNKQRSYCDPFAELDSHVVGCLYDGYSGRLAFYLNGEYKGVAFTNVNKPNDQTTNLSSSPTLLYPMISSTVANSVFRLEFAYESFPTLQEICSIQIKNKFDLGNSIYKRFLV